MEGIVSGMRPILTLTSTLVTLLREDKWMISCDLDTPLPALISYNITRGRVVGHTRTMSTTSEIT